MTPDDIRLYRQDCIDGVLDIEKGYVDDPDDSGGETNWGITVAVARENGYTGPMRDMPQTTARKIYQNRYWRAARLDSVVEAGYPHTARLVLECAVHSGPAVPSRWLQRALNVLNNRGRHYADIAADGVVGPRTVAALEGLARRRGAKDADLAVFKAITSWQGAFLLELAERREKDEKYVFGWLKNRVADPQL